MSGEFVEVAGEGGREKAFVLSKTKTPAEQAREKNIAMMPQVRFSVSQLRIPAAAKWLFDRFSDDSFRDDRGGDGYGSVWTTIKDLSDMYHHDRERIASWLKILEDASVVWTERDRGFLVVRISAFVAPPTIRASMVARLKARRSRSVRVANPDTEKNFAKSSNPARKAAETGEESPDLPHDVRQNATRRGANPVTACGKSGQEMPENATRRGAKAATPCGKSPHGVRDLSAEREAETRIEGEESSITTGRKSSLETSPSVKSGEKENSLSVQRGNALKKKGKENSFLDEVRRVLELYSPKYADQEMSGSGAWWRLQYRKDADKAWRVLADVENMVKEGAIIKNPGAAAVDLWNRLP